MNEEQYQFGLRSLPPATLIEIIMAYREELRTCAEMFKSYAQKNFADEPLHKVASASKSARIDAMVSDYDIAVKYWED